MGLFKDVKKPVIKAATAGSEVSPQRPSYVAKTPPCTAHCPCGTKVRDWLVPLAQFEAFGRTRQQAFETAWRKITETNPFPAVCGRLCQHPCENFCNRKEKDGGVAVNLLERFVGEFGITNHLQLAGPSISLNLGSVAVVGAGPAGLACAYHLRRLGYQVTILDAAPKPGGMMRYRIPRSLLPGEILDAEIANILNTGIELSSGCLVGRDLTEAELVREHSAVFFASGLQKPAQIEIRCHPDDGTTVGELPSDGPGEAIEPTEPDRKAMNSVSFAIAQGCAVAQELDDFLQKRSARKPTAPVVQADRMKLDWYPAAPRHTVPISGGPEAPGVSEVEAVDEAKRCLSCGMCMDCENCWMYCTNNCFVKLPKGQHYNIKLELCNGCKKCADACPCRYIEMN